MSRETARYDYTLGSSRGSAVVYDDDTKIHVHSDTSPARGQQSAWDLVRLSKFSHLDRDAGEMPIGERPSQKAMIEFAESLPEIKAQRAAAAFEDMGPTPPSADIEQHRARPKRKRPISRRFDTIREESLVTIYPGLLFAGKHTTIGGDPGLGKSLVSTDIAARISRGGRISPYSDEQFEPATVIMCSAEDAAADTVKPRLRTAGADMARIVDLIGVLGPEDGQEHLNLGEHLPVLNELLGDTKARVLVLDPISSFLGKIDSHQNSQVRGVIDPIKRILERHKAALLSVQHLNKNERASVINRFSGSISFVGAPRMAFVFMCDRTQGSKADRWLLPAKSNLLPDAPGYGLRIGVMEGQPLLDWRTERVDLDVNDVLGAAAPTKTTLAEDMLRAVLVPGAEVPAADIERMCRERGFGRQARRDALRSIGAQAKRVGAKGTKDGRWVWSLPPGLIRDDEGFDDTPHVETVAQAARAPLEAAAAKLEEDWVSE